MPRTIGPFEGPGVSVTERDATQPITPGTLGGVAWSGIVERGPTDKLMFLTSKSDVLAQTGNYTSDSLLPDALRDFFDSSGGAGFVLLQRVTDGSEVKSTFPLYMRRATLTQLGYLEAHNGGRWGGYAAKFTGDIDVSNIAETTITTGEADVWATDQWKGGYVELAGVPNKRYEIVGNDTAGVITVASDATMDTDLDVSTDGRYYLVLEQREDRGLEIEIRDGDTDPEGEFSIAVRLDGTEVKVWPSLSVDPNAANYWVNVINTNADRGTNYYVRAVDTWTGARPADVRPANLYGARSTLTERVLTATVHEFTINSVGGGDPTFALDTLTDDHEPQVITITMTDATNGTAVSDKYGTLGAVTLDALFTPDVKWAPPFTVSAGGSPLAAADTLEIVFKPLGKTDELVDGTLYPDKDENPETFYNILSNTNDTITVSFGVDMATDVAGGGDNFMVIKHQRMVEGVDGHADVTDNDYVAVYDTANSRFRQIRGKGFGLVKFAVPGVTSVTVQKAMAAFVDSGKAGRHMPRFEVPANVTKESEIYNFASSLGKSPYGDYVISAQSYGYVIDPEGNGQVEKVVSLTGMIQGREAAIAVANGGYQKPAAGTTVTLPRVTRLLTGDQALDTEYLYPRGINTIELRGGQFVVWGNTTFTSNTAWKQKQQRELMSYYTNVLLESFDWAVFEINDRKLWGKLRSSLTAYFFTEYGKRALDNNLPFDLACVIKIDAENNTPASLEDGQVKADITLSLAKSADKIRFSLGKLGITDSEA
jgi:hypothetical protein